MVGFQTSSPWTCLRILNPWNVVLGGPRQTHSKTDLNTLCWWMMIRFTQKNKKSGYLRYYTNASNPYLELEGVKLSLKNISTFNPCIATFHMSCAMLSMFQSLLEVEIEELWRYPLKRNETHWWPIWLSQSEANYNQQSLLEYVCIWSTP